MKKYDSEQGSAHIVIIIILILVIIGLLGFVFWQNFIAKDANGSTPKNETQATSKQTNSASEQTPAPTSKTFTYAGNTANAVAPFSFQYPLDWTVNVNASDPNINSTATGPRWSLFVKSNSVSSDSITMYTPQSNSNLDTYVSTNVNIGGSSNGIPFVYTELNRNSVGGDSAVSYKSGYGAGQGGFTYGTVVSHDGYIYEIFAVSSADSNTLDSATQTAYNKMLQTWKWSR
jgi:cytoskeletal protein RodZ